MWWAAALSCQLTSYGAASAHLQRLQLAHERDEGLGRLRIQNGVSVNLVLGLADGFYAPHIYLYSAAFGASKSKQRSQWVLCHLQAPAFQISSMNMHSATQLLCWPAN